MEEDRLLGSLRALLEIGREINALKPIDTLLDLIVKKADELFHESYSSIILYDADKEMWVKGVSTDENHRFDIHRFVRKKGASDTIVKTRKPLIVEDVDKSPYGQHPFLKMGKIRSFIGVPIVHNDKVKGVLYVYSSEEMSFSEEDVELLRIFAEYAAVALYNNELYEELRRTQIEDTLTGLYNNLYVRSILERESMRNRESNSISVLLMDVVGMKEINRKYGFEFGDYVLREVGKRIKETLRKVHVPARYTSDEFLVVLMGDNERRAKEVAGRIVESVSNAALVADNTEIRLALNAGVAELQRGMGYNVLMNSVEEALFEAKRRGPNQIVAASDIE